MTLSCVNVYGPRLFATPHLKLDRLHGTVRQNYLSLSVVRVFGTISSLN